MLLVTYLINLKNADQFPASQHIFHPLYHRNTQPNPSFRRAGRFRHNSNPVVLLQPLRD